MATKPKAILSTHDGREASPITKASNVLFENGQTAQDILNDRQDAMISPVIENSSSMFKVGQGDNVDYSNNVVNGAYESMVLKGKSMVNCIQEPSSQDVVLPYEFEEGQYVTINDTKESGALGVELKGQTLVNSILSIDKTLPYTWVSNDIASRACALRGAFKTGVYALIVEFGEVLLGGVQSSQGVSSAIQVNYTDGTSNSYTRSGLENYSKQRFFTTFTINKEVASVEFKGTAAQYENVTTEGYVPPTVTINKIMILEYQEGMENWDIPYFEGMTSCKMPILHTVGKNLFNINGYSTKNQYASINGNTITVNAPTTFSNTVYTLTGLKEGELYRVSLDKTGAGEFSIRDTNASSLLYVEKEEGHVSRTFTYEKGATIRIGNRQIVNSEVSFANIQIEHGSTETAHESYKSSSLSLPEEVVLRSLPNGVCDTFNTRTGVYTQRIGEVVLDGSHSTRTVASAVNSELYQPYIISGLSNVKNIKETAITVNCDKLITRSARTTSYPSFTDNSIAQYVDSSAAFVGVLLKSTLANLTPQQWFESNPVRVQYELETPVITKINLPSTLKSWNTTTHIYSEIPENTLYPILSHSNPSYPVILKPSTKYSIVANSYSNNHTNSAINFNLGGATASTTVGNRVTTITTPSTLSNELLTMSGRGNKLNNVMVIEGDVVGDEPYFEGICDCKSPILSNVGKNLFDNVFTVGGWWDGVPDCNPDLMRSVNLTPVKPNTTYAYDSTVKGHRQSANFMAHDADGNFIKYLGFGRTFTTPSNCHYIHLYAENDNSLYAQIEEGNVSTTIEPYKSNILSCNGDKIELTEDMFEQGTVSGAVGVGSKYGTMKENSTVRLRSKDIIKVKPNTKYRLFRENGYDGWCVAFDSNQTYLGKSYQTETFTTDSQTHYIVPVLKKTDNSTMVLSALSNFTLSEVDKTIVLRSLPNGVCDTLNVETGEYVQRIGELVFNGSESWNVNNSFDTKTTKFFFIHNSNLPEGVRRISTLASHYASSNYFSRANANYRTDAKLKELECVMGGDGATGMIQFYIKQSRLSSPDLTGFKQWLSQNPTTVQYVLETPIVKTVDLSGFPFSYENGHVQLSSGSIEQSLTPTVEYSVATNRNGQIRSNQKMVERHQKQLDQLQAIILANLVNSQYNQTLTTLKYELSRV